MKSTVMVLMIGASCATNVALAGVCDPMAVHVTNDGGAVVLSSPANGVNFDMRGDGVVRVSWPSTGNDAWLVLPNATGKVTSGAQMFGADSAKGADADAFRVLAQYDDPENGGNGDGIISDQDPVYASLRLWADVNRNGAVDDGELSTLPDHGIHALVLASWGVTRRDAVGNAYLSQAKIVGADDTADKRFLQAVIPNVAAAPDGHTSAVTCDGGNPGGSGSPPPSTPPPAVWHCTASCSGGLTGHGLDIAYTLWQQHPGQDQGICGVPQNLSQNTGTWYFTGQTVVDVSRPTAEENAQQFCFAQMFVYSFSYYIGATEFETNPYHNEVPGNGLDKWCEYLGNDELACLQY